jgi:hypothetical protein
LVDGREDNFVGTFLQKLGGEVEADGICSGDGQRYHIPVTSAVVELRMLIKPARMAIDLYSELRHARRFR